MKCADVDTMLLLAVIGAAPRRWANLGIMRDEIASYFPGVPDKLMLAKLRQLTRKGFVSGCTCSCRGDFNIKEKGREFLLKHKAQYAEGGMKWPLT